MKISSGICSSALPILFAAAAGLSVSACGEGRESTAPLDDRDPSTVVDGNWPNTGRNFSEDRFSPLDQISHSNVSELGLAWRMPVATATNLKGTPIAVNGSLFVTDGWGVVSKVDGASGELIWRYAPEPDHSAVRGACCTVLNRGPTSSDGKVFAAAFDGQLFALDMESGEEIWKVDTIDGEGLYSSSGAPRIAGENVLIGNAGAEFAVRGYVSAYNKDTGELAWRFYTVPGNPGDGFENAAMEMAAGTWNGAWWENGGGGTVWDSMSYDPELDLVYIGVGNGSPWNRETRSPGGGDNLFLSSIVALNATTGDYVWHYQTTPGDSWDFTATSPMVLTDIEIDGQLRQVIMQSPKNGFFYVLDRRSGELLSADPIATVNWASHVDMETGRPVEHPNARFIEEPFLGIPGPSGHRNWHGMSFHRPSGLMFMAVNETAFLFTQTDDIVEVQGRFRQDLGYRPWQDLASILEERGVTLEGQYLLAWDPVARKEAWRASRNPPRGGSVLSTAGELVFQSDRSGEFAAYHARTGERLWSASLNTGAVGGPISYEVDGRQYIAILGGHAHPGYNMARNAALFAFSLGGDRPLPARIDWPADNYEAVTLTVEQSAMVGLGDRLYHAHCMHCHGPNAASGGNVSDLRHSHISIFDIWTEIVLDGTLESNGMPAHADVLTQDESDAIKYYVQDQANLRKVALSGADD
ncbi:MAG: PQQ-dependent dehydrogenase, methanol/ethanol family [Gammaproteobacteria bacterium]|nr:PQQ-dependent dehydrogenase, methanol/ethanol family [Gammaproteobacteria bacterium]